MSSLSWTPPLDRSCVLMQDIYKTPLGLAFHLACLL